MLFRSKPQHEIAGPQAATPQAATPQAAGPQALGDLPGDTVAPSEVQPAANHVPHPEHAPQPTPPLDRNQPSPANPRVLPEGIMRVPGATDSVFGGLLDTTSSLRLPFSIKKGRFGNRR